jgi:quercetin dioxygenase-like cupin family protein
MMNPPLPFTPDSFQRLGTHELAAELIERARTEPDGKAARTLLKSAELTIVAMALRAGASLLEHSARGPVLVVPLVGRVTFEADSLSASEEVAHGHALAMGASLRHAVTATEDAAFLLVIGARPAG